MLQRTRGAVWLAGAAVAALSLAACTSSSGDASGSSSAESPAATAAASETAAPASSSAPAVPRGDTLNLGVSVALPSLAAVSSNWGAYSVYTQAVYDSLLAQAPDGSVIPALATAWEYNADKTVLTLTLRDDVTFTDGTAFDASVAAQNLLRFRDGDSPQKGQLTNLKDAKPVDPTTLEITLTAPDPAMLVYLAQNAGAQESPAAFGSADEKTVPIGSGPYVLDSTNTVIGSKYVYTANPNYWNMAGQHYDNLVINVYQTVATQSAALLANQVNVSNLIDPSANDQLEGAGLTLLTNELDWAGLILLDRDGTVNKALGDVRVRQAINYAIDRDGMLKAIAKGNGTVTGQVFGKASGAYVDTLDDQYPYDPEKAKSLLAEAGQSSFTLQMMRAEGLPPAIFTLVKQYLEAVGIKVDYVQTPLNNYIGDMLAAKYAAAWMQLQQDPTAWQTASFEIAPQAQFNPFHTTTPEVESLLAAMQTGDDSAASDAAQQLNTYVVDQAWFNPWYRNTAFVAADANTSVTIQADNVYPYLQNIQPKS